MRGNLKVRVKVKVKGRRRMEETWQLRERRTWGRGRPASKERVMGEWKRREGERGR